MASLTISPSQTEIQIIPGSTYIQSYTIKNNSDFDVVLFSSVESWQPQGINGNISYNSNLPSQINFSLSNSDLKLNQNFVLKPSESKQLVLKIKTSSNLNESDFYFTFFINQTDANYQNLVKIGSHILISVSQNQNPAKNASVPFFSAFPKISDCFFNQILIDGQIENQSSYFFKPNATISLIKNNSEISKLIIFPSNILSFHQRQILCLDQLSNSPQNCNIKKPLWPGIYQLKLNSSDPNFSSSTNFFVFPFSIFLPIFLFFLILKFKKIKK
jgi:hypothetical protein